MMTIYRQVFRQIPRQATLLARPFEDVLAVRLRCDPEDLAIAGAVSASVRVPVDVSVALCFEALDAVPESNLMAVLSRVGELDHHDAPADLTGWIDQLRLGCRWYEDQLPLIMAPSQLAARLESTPVDAVRLAGDLRTLQAVLTAEIAAASNGRMLGDLLAQLEVGALL